MTPENQADIIVTRRMGGYIGRLDASVFHFLIQDIAQALRQAHAEGTVLGNGLADVLDHAIETEQFTVGGSTEMWAKDELAKFRESTG